MDDVTKLPKWAQRRIEQLEANVEYANDKLRQMETGDTEIFIRDYQRGNIALPKGSEILFVLSNGEVSARVTEEGLTLNGSASRGHYGLSFHPRSFNHGIVKVVE